MNWKVIDHEANEKLLCEICRISLNDSGVCPRSYHSSKWHHLQHGMTQRLFSKTICDQCSDIVIKKLKCDECKILHDCMDCLIKLDLNELRSTIKNIKDIDAN